MSIPESWDSLEQMVGWAEKVHHDIDFTIVREWKDAEEGRVVVGYLPAWAPRELIHATGALPVSMSGGGDDIEIIKGDAYFQSYICHIPRSAIELGLAGKLEAFDAFIFPSICDVIRNLSGMWKMLFKDQVALYLDMPQSHDAIGAEFFSHELRVILDRLEELTGRPVTDDAIRASVAVYNENRRLLDELDALRRESPHLVPTHETYLIVRAGGVIPVEDYNTLLADYLTLARASDRRPMDNARVVVAGSFCERPPLNLIRAIERSGCYIVDDDLNLCDRLVEGDVKCGEEPLNDYAAAFIGQAREAAFLYCSGKKGVGLVEKVRASKAEGVLFCAPSFCDPALLDQPMLCDGLDEEGIEYTSFKYAENTGQFQVIREQAGTFADSIKLWSAV